MQILLTYMNASFVVWLSICKVPPAEIKKKQNNYPSGFYFSLVTLSETEIEAERDIKHYFIKEFVICLPF